MENSPLYGRDFVCYPHSGTTEQNILILHQFLLGNNDGSCIFDQVWNECLFCGFSLCSQHHLESLERQHIFIQLCKKGLIQA